MSQGKIFCGRGLCQQVCIANERPPVEKIKVRDRVLSHSASTGKNEFEPVTALTPPHLDKLVELRIAGEQDVLHPSEHHPFWVKRSEGDSGNWIEPANLRVGELLETTEGKWRKIDSVTQLNREETVYNFTVAEDHDYFVGQTGFLVHNTECPPCRTGRGRNKLSFDPCAIGWHSTFGRGPDGRVNKWQQWFSNPQNPNGFDPGMRYDGTTIFQVHFTRNPQLQP